MAERRRVGSQGAPHGGEIRFVCGNGAAGPMAQSFTDADKLVAGRVSGYWVKFAVCQAR